MTIESEIAGLTQATTDLLSAVNVRKTVLDEKVGNADAFAQASLTSANNAAASAAAANTKAGEAAGSAASALAIYGNTAAQQAAVTAAQNAASVAAGHAASASSVVQQDLSGVTAAALHRSPNAVTAMFVYDTSKDSDGGAWTEKCQHTSWYNEAINGKWLGAQASEAAARAVSGATTGDYFQLTTDGKFYRLWKNLLQQSNSFANAYWTKNASVTVVDNVGYSTVTVPNTIGAGVNIVFKQSITTISVAAYQVQVRGTAGQSITIADDYGSQTVTFDGTWQTASFTTNSSGGFHQLYIRTAVANQAYSFDVRNAQLEPGSVATTYEAKTTDGTQTEVFRGNKRDFPRLAGIVAEAASVTIYDLTEAGRPMWMRTTTELLRINGGFQSLGALNGNVLIGASSNVIPLGIFNYIKDDVRVGVAGYYNAPAFSYRQISQRNLNTGGFGDSKILRNRDGIQLAGSNTNAVAMTVLPDAPVDPVTGLKVPTIAVATSGGVSVIKQDGTVVSQLASTINVVFAKDNRLWAAGSDGGSYAVRLINKAFTGVEASFANIRYAIGAPYIAGNSVERIPQLRAAAGNAVYAVDPDTYKTVNILRSNNSKKVGSSVAYICETFNTGHQPGDIRRTYLADIDAGSVSGTELVTNGTFETDLSGWTNTSTGSGSATYSGGTAALVGTDTANRGMLTQQVAVTAGKVYRVTYTISRTSGALGAGFVTSLGTVPTTTYETASGTFSYLLIAPASNCYFAAASHAGGGNVSIDNISIKEAVADRSYKAAAAHITGILAKTAVASAAQMVAYSGFSAANYLREPYSADMDFGTGEWSASAWVSIPTANAAAGIIVSRAHSSGSYITLGIDATNKVTATVFDGTTTRTVTTTAAYNTATWLKARVNYTTDGSLAILVNGVEVAVTRGAPLLTLNNSNAVLTIGNSYAADAPFPGSIALLKFSATVPTPEQSVWMYEQEKQMFREGAQVTLPDSNVIADLAYDEVTDKWIAVSATNESEWSGLVRTGVTAVPAGSFSKVAATSGVKLEARTTTSPGVDITIPAYGLREELVKRAESAARLARGLTTFDYVGGFTANTTTGSTSITSVAGLSYPTSTIGAKVTGAGIPTDTVITAVSGTTIYLSKAATATGTAVQISFTDFALPVGYEAKAVMSAGTLKQEGSTKDFTRLFDGFKETIRFGVAPGYTAWVQIQATRSAA